jgi:anti-anti-sigma regulatory factor
MEKPSGTTSCQSLEKSLYCYSAKSAETVNMKSFKAIELAGPITKTPSYLVTRVTGKRFWLELQKLLQKSRVEPVIALDFSEVEIMDASFADEVFGSFAALRGRKESNLGPIVLVGVNETCRDNLQMALETRPDREDAERDRLRNSVLAVLENSELALVGKFEEHVQESFDLLMQKGELTARELVDMLGLSLNAASTRLKTLADLGLAVRIELRDAQGKQYIYHRLQ